MSAKDRMGVLSAMMEQGVVPVFYHPDAKVCIDVVRVCVLKIRDPLEEAR